MKDKVLVIAAHPDDEVLGCGGTIRRLANEKKDVYVAILGEGITSRYKNTNKKKTDELKRGSYKASKLLGAKDTFLFGFPDNRLDTVALLDIVKKVEHLIKQIKPTIIFTHHSSDLNIDHKIVHQAVLTATRPVEGTIVRGVYMFEVPSSTEWSFGQFKPSFSPNVFYDISKTVNIKIEALKAYKSELRKFPHPRSPEALLAISRKWGSVVGFKAAEPFELLRSIR